MKALMCSAHGAPSGLSLEDVPSPEPGPRQVRIQVRAAGVNFPDLLMVQGRYQFQPPLPFAPGNEVAGEVAALGDEVEGLSVGDRVVALVPFGGFAEEVVADVASVLPLPDGMGDEAAAGFVLTYATARHALADRGALEAGETLLVLGAAGGVGLAAVQIGKAMGAKVIAAASSPEKLATCKENGADLGIDYSSEDLKKQVKALTDGRGADVIFDPVGGSFAEPALRAIAWEGRYLVIGFAAGEIPKIPLNLPLLKGCAILGVFWGSFAARAPERHRAHVEWLVEQMQAGTLRPHVSKTYPLAEGAQALEDLAARKVQGKAILTMR